MEGIFQSLFFINLNLNGIEDAINRYNYNYNRYSHGQTIDVTSNVLTNETASDANEEANNLINATSNALAKAMNLTDVTMNSDTPQQQRQLESLQELRNYCFQHASDSPNPVKDLVDKGFLPENFVGETCKSVKGMIDKIQLELQIQSDIQAKEQQKQRDIEANQRSPYDAYLIENAMNNTKFNNCLNQGKSVTLCYDTFTGSRPL
jgi:ATP-dependent Lon protease